uniref:LIM zinc-binding domain-containing protein n=1 Tax=Cynoglossus semilaevis TaxID=244447 RepID=A0A3P8UZ39_CYNSE
MTVVLMKDGLRTPPFHHYQDLDCQTVVFLSLCPQCPAGSSSVCVFCKDRVYVMERLSAEGLFFHRSCFQCNFCGDTLKLTGYTFDQQHEGEYSPWQMERHSGLWLLSEMDSGRNDVVM